MQLPRSSTSFSTELAFCPHHIGENVPVLPIQKYPSPSPESSVAIPASCGRDSLGRHEPAAGKNCFYPDGENVVARAAANANALHITNGGIEKLVASGKGPVWWQLETGGSLKNRASIRALAERLEEHGCSGICVSTDI